MKNLTKGAVAVAAFATAQKAAQKVVQRVRAGDERARRLPPQRLTPGA